MADHTTTRFALTGLDPAGTELVTNLPTQLNALADQIDAKITGWSSGVFASRPAAGTKGRLYFATDDTTSTAHGTLYFDDGTAWNQVQIGAATSVASSVDSIFKPGDLKMIAKASPDSGWLLCDGSTVSRTTYAALYSAVGSTWGAGNGTTTFNVPDLRGRAPVGAGTGSGLTARSLAATGGAETHSHTANIPSHTHPISSDGDHTHGIGSANRGTASSPTSGSGETTAYTNHVHTVTNAGSHSHGGATAGPSTTAFTTNAGSTMGPFAVVNYVIKT